MDLFRPSLTNNLIQNTAQDGILIVFSHGRIVGNTIESAGNHGVALQGGNMLLSNNQIRQNRVAGVHLEGSATVIASDNTITQNGSNGIELRTNSQGTMTNNTITGNGTQPPAEPGSNCGIHARHSRANIFNGNTIADKLTPPVKKEGEKSQPKRQALPADLPRREIRHEPETRTCRCGCELKRIGEDVAEKLDYEPGVFTVERHVRGKWVCGRCQTLIQAPVAPHVIDKGIPTAGLIANVLVSKYHDHLPLYRQEGIYARAGVAIARSTLAQWVGAAGVALTPIVQAMREDLMSRKVLHADETPVSMLKPGTGRTHRAYLWGYCTTVYDPVSAVVFDFAESRSGRHARSFLGFKDEDASAGWRGTLVCDDYSAYKALFVQGVTEAGCLAHARRKFHELWVNHRSSLAEEALKLFGRLYDVEREVQQFDAEERRRRRELQAKPVADLLHAWLIANRQKVPDGSATAKAIDYSLGRWAALTRYLGEGALPADNNRLENLIRPIALGRANWLFAGSLRAGQRAAAVMSLVHSARLNGHDPYAYLKDVLERLPTQPASRIGELLPYRWQAAAAAC